MNERPRCMYPGSDEYTWFLHRNHIKIGFDVIVGFNLIQISVREIFFILVNVKNFHSEICVSQEVVLLELFKLNLLTIRKE